MSDLVQGKSKATWAFVLVPLMVVIGLAGCISGGGSSESGVVVAAGPVVPPAPISFPITAFVNAGGGNLTITSANTLAPGDIVVISGTTNYNGTFTIVSANATTFTITAAFVANDATGVWTAGGGVIAGCTTTGAGITLPAMNTVASRFTGVAPLAVFFDATATTGSVTHPFHELVYTWSFGDPAGGATWGYGTGSNNSKNAASGPVAAHVFETAGTYVVNLTVKDGVNTVSNSCMQIAVQDPSVVFAGPKTICMNRTLGALAGCPAGATEYTDLAGDFDVAVAANLATGKRLLVNRGETWFTSAFAPLDKTGPWTIGAYGAGAKPIVQRAAGVTILGIGIGGGGILTDARVMDLTLDGTPGGVSTKGLAGVGTFDQFTLLRIDIINTLVGFELDLNQGGLARAWDQFTIADSTVSIGHPGGGGNSMFLAASRQAILGNQLDNNGIGEHNYRSMYWSKLVLSNNTFTTPNSGKANITLRGAHWLAGLGPVPANTYSQYGVISDNEIIGGPGVDVPVNTSIDPSVPARTRYLIFERNWWHGHPGVAGGGTALGLNSDFSTVRNNILDLTDAGNAGYRCFDVAVAIGGPGDPPTQPNPTTNWFYNNTCYTNAPLTVASVFRGINLSATADNTTIKNFLVYAPNAAAAGTNVVVVQNSGTGTVGASGTFGNSSNLQAKTDPLFASATPTVPAHFKPTGVSYAIGAQGFSVATPLPGVLSDFFLAAQPTPSDIGAVVH